MRIFDECNILISYVIIDNSFKCCQDVLNENIFDGVNSWSRTNDLIR